MGAEHIIGVYELTGFYSSIQRSFMLYVASLTYHSARRFVIETRTSTTSFKENGHARTGSRRQHWVLGRGSIQRTCSVRERLCAYPFPLRLFSWPVLWIAWRSAYVADASTSKVESFSRYEQESPFEWVRNMVWVGVMSGYLWIISRFVPTCLSAHHGSLIAFWRYPRVIHLPCT